MEFAFLLLLFAACVLTVLFWAAVFAAALMVMSALSLALQAVWWLITRPFVWLVIRPLQFIFGSERSSPTQVRLASAGTAQTVDQLTRLQTLLATKAITQEEFDRMKGAILAR